MKWVLLGLVVAATVISDLLQSYQMKIGGEQALGARGMAQLLRKITQNRYLILSIVFLAISFFAFMALIQTEALSFAVPASAASFVVETILARLLLKEHISMRRGAGAVLVLCGIVLLAA
jgi:uncharacterized membrane protein